MRKAAKVYDAAQGVEDMTPKITKMNHKKCSPQEFGRMVKEAGPLLSGLGQILRRGGSAAVDNLPIVTAGGGAVAGYGMAGDTPVDKLEGTIAGGLIGLGGGSFANPSAWRNVHLKAKADAAALAGTRVGKTKMRGDYWSPYLKHMTKDMLVPKLTFVGAGTATPLIRQVGKSVDDISAMTGSARKITEDAAGLSGDIAQKDTEGKSVADRLRETVDRISEDSKATSGAIAEGTKNVSANLSDATGGLKDTAGAVGRVADSMDRLTGPMAEEWTRKDEEGKTPITNLNTLLSNLSKWTSPDSMTPMWASVVDGVRKYGPTAAGVGAGGLGLYALYKYLGSKEKKKKLRHEAEPKFASEMQALSRLFRSPAAAGRSAMMAARKTYGIKPGVTTYPTMDTVISPSAAKGRMLNPNQKYIPNPEAGLPGKSTMRAVGPMLVPRRQALKSVGNAAATSQALQQAGAGAAAAGGLGLASRAVLNSPAVAPYSVPAPR